MERIDDLQYNGLKLIQDDNQFCFGCDAVELANFVKSSASDICCDLGCGNGIIPVLLAAKRKMKVVGVEIQPAAASLAQRNAELNSMTDKIRIVNARMQDFAENSAAGAFDVVTCNPPYRKAGSGFKQEKDAIAVARHEIEITLRQVVACAARLLKCGGKFYTVGQAQRLAETIELCQQRRLTVKTIQILRPCDNKPPHLFLMKCIKDGKDGTEILPERCVRAYGMD